jgi:hypothetical protein
MDRQQKNKVYSSPDTGLSQATNEHRLDNLLILVSIIENG